MSIAKGTPAEKFFGRKVTIRQRMMKRIFLTVIFFVPPLLGVGLGLGGYLTRGSDAHVAPTPKLLPVETMRVEAVGSYRTYRAYTGKIVARRTSNLGFERKGKLVFIVVEEGDRVAAGALLARLDTQELEASRRELLARRAQAAAKLAEMIAGPRSETIAAARAQVNEFREQLALAKIRRRRRERLLAEKVISREQFDEAASQSKTLQAKVDAAQSRLDELLAGTRKEQIRAQRALTRQLDARLAAIEIELKKSALRAPFAGTISQRRSDEGTVVASGQPILRLVEDGALEARIGVPIHVAKALKPGSGQILQNGRETYRARVSALLPELDPTTRTVTVVLALDSSAAGKVVTGQMVRLRHEEMVEAAGFWVPTAALVKGVRGLWSLYVLVENHSLRTETKDGREKMLRAQRRDVEVLHTGADRVFVRGTLLPGDLIVRSGTHRIAAGQIVRAVPLS